MKQAVARAESRANAPNALPEALRALMPKGQSLVAHLESGPSLDLAALRHIVAQKLPVLHRPTHYVLHETFPLSPNGKIDVKALAAGGQGAAVQAPAEAGNPTPAGVPSDAAALVTEIFRKALANPAIGPEDSFFEFGGYSLLALKTLMEIEAALGVSVSISDLYEHSSAAELCRVLGAGAPDTGGDIGGNTPSEVPRQPADSFKSIVIPYRKTGTRTPIFALHNLETNGDLYRPLVAHLGADQPFYGIGQVDLPSVVNSNWVENPDWPTRVEDVAAHYVAQINRLAPDGPVIVAGFCLGAVYAYEVARQLDAAGRRPEHLIMLQDTHSPDFGLHDVSRIKGIAVQRWDQIQARPVRGRPACRGTRS